MLVMLMFLMLNYGLLVVAKLLVGAAHPFTFPNGGVRLLILVWLVELVVLGLLLAFRATQNMLRFNWRVKGGNIRSATGTAIFLSQVIQFPNLTSCKNK